MSNLARIILLLLFCCSVSVQADEDKRSQNRNEFQERMRDLAKEVAEAVRSGKHAEARELQQEIRELMQQEAMQRRGPKLTEHRGEDHERRELMLHFEKLVRRSHELRKAGKHKEAQELSEEIKKLNARLHHKGEHSHPPEIISEEKKIHQLHRAAEELEAGGFHNEARDFHERAEHLEHQLREHQREEHEHHHEPDENEMQQIRQAFKNVHDAVEQLQEQTRKLQLELGHVKKELSQLREKQRTQSASPDMQFHPPGGPMPPRRNLGTPGQKLPHPPEANPRRRPSRTDSNLEKKQPAEKRRSPEPKSKKTPKDVKEVVLSMNSMKFMLDLDSGETMDPPATVRPEQAKMDIAPLQQQPYEQPLVISGQNLLGFRVKSDDWNLSSHDLQKKLSAYPLSPLTKLKFDDTQAATFLYQTKDGGEGVLQLVGLVDEPKGIRLRYRTLK